MADFNIKDGGGCVIMEISGEIDAHVAPQFDKKLKEALAQNPKVVLDVSGLSYIATAGLGALAASFNEATSGGGSIVLAGMIDKVKKVFDVMGFSKMYTITASVDEAKTKLG